MKVAFQIAAVVCVVTVLGAAWSWERHVDATDGNLGRRANIEGVSRNRGDAAGAQYGAVWVPQSPDAFMAGTLVLGTLAVASGLSAVVLFLNLRRDDKDGG